MTTTTALGRLAQPPGAWEVAVLALEVGMVVALPCRATTSAMIEVLTSACARLCGRRGAANRAKRAAGTVRPQP